MLFLAYVMTASNYRHTYQLAASVGTLDSQRWSFDFIVTASLIFVFLVPLTLSFYLVDTSARGRWIAHVVIVALLTVWIFATFIYGCVYLANRNKTDATNFNNPFNDEKWCLVNAGISGVPCYISAPTGLFSLSVSTPALIQFIFQLVVFLLLIVDLFVVLIGLRRAVANEAQKETEEPLIGARSTYKSKKKRTN